MERTNLENFFDHYDDLRGAVDRLLDHIESEKRRAKETYFDKRESDDEQTVREAFEARGRARMLEQIEHMLERTEDAKERSERVYLNLITIMEELDQSNAGADGEDSGITSCH